MVDQGELLTIAYTAPRVWLGLKRPQSAKSRKKLLCVGMSRDPAVRCQRRQRNKNRRLDIGRAGVAGHADAITVATEWGEFRQLDWERIRRLMTRSLVFDARNLLSPGRMKSLGFEYHSIGRPAV